jgi:beta-glucosidase-like glycosyl hydrolase
MTTHMQVPALDRDLPTSLSPAVIQGVLRRESGYDRLVISDSLAMGALARFSMPHAARLDDSVLRILRFKLDWLGAELARDTASVGGEDVA